MTLRRKIKTDDGFTISYAVAGEGPSLILIPDALYSVQSWIDAGYFDALAPDFRVIAIDPLGHGQSDAPTIVEAYGAEAVVGHVLAVLEKEAVVDACLWGYGTGAEVGALVARRRPDRISALVYGGAYLGDAVEGLQALGLDERALASRCVRALHDDDWEAYFDLCPFELAPETRANLAATNDPAVVAALTQAAHFRPRRFLKPAAATFAYWARGEPFALGNQQLTDSLPLEWTIVPGSHDDGFSSAPEIIQAVKTFVSSTVTA